MASSSSSSSTRPDQVEIDYKYDVFLSFRGEDTRNNITSHLHAALCRRKIHTFIDDQLTRGDVIESALSQTIQESKISVIIFSKNYADSGWCLQELEWILGCMRKREQIVMPVFYHVDPKDVKKQTRTFGEGFARLHKRLKERFDELTRWKAALEEAAGLAGYHINGESPESKYVEEIVEDILKRLSRLSASDNKDLVGVESAIRKIESLLCVGSTGFCIVGIWGIGGIGKTTLARAIFDKILSKFECSYFARNVREESEMKRLTHLKKDILSTMLGGGHTNIESTFVKERLGRARVLIVFDDVTSFEQIEELMVDLRCLGSGSRILITSRDKQVFANHGVEDANICEVGGLCDNDALQLFSKYAFRKNHPIKGFEDLSMEIVKYTKGVPLALKVLGSCLFGKKKRSWNDEMNKLKKSPHKNIQEVLKISYDGLDDEEKVIFLDIACFFKEWKKSKVQDILDASGFSTEIGISCLIDKALISISSSKTITMHDLLQEMGREIVRKESIKNLSERSRLWDRDDINKVFSQNLGIQAIQGIKLNDYDIIEMGGVALDFSIFKKMPDLRFLELCSTGDEDKWQGFEEPDYFSTKLTCFIWRMSPLKSWPSNFQAESLVELDLRVSKFEKLWTGVQNLANLKYLDLSASQHLTEIPNLSKAGNLKELLLGGCKSLSDINSASIQNLNKLVKLNLTMCARLRSLPCGIQSKSISLAGCFNINVVPKMSSKVRRLNLACTRIKELPFIEQPSELIVLDLTSCTSLERLSSNLCKCKLLKSLSLNNCSSLVSLPNDFGKLKALETFKTFGTHIREAPSSIFHFSKLSSLSLPLKRPYKWLDMKQEEDILVLNSVSGLRSLKLLELPNWGFTKLPDDLGQLSYVKTLNLSGNKFESIPASIKDLPKLRFLNLSHCKRLQSLPELPRAINLAADGCTSLEFISDLSFLFSPMLRPQRINFANCCKLNLAEILNQECRQEICDGICYPGNEIPQWFKIQEEGSSLSLNEPPNWNDKSFRGFLLCAVVTSPSQEYPFYIEYEFEYRLMISKLKDGSDDPSPGFFIYSIKNNDVFIPDERFRGLNNFINSDHVFLGFVKSNNMKNMKKIKFEVSGLQVKKCGIHFLYAQDCGEPRKTSSGSFITEGEEDDEPYVGSRWKPVGFRILGLWSDADFDEEDKSEEDEEEEKEEEEEVVMEEDEEEEEEEEKEVMEEEEEEEEEEEVVVVQEEEEEEEGEEEEKWVGFSFPVYSNCTISFSLDGTYKVEKNNQI